jgi:hypothetical protein
MIMPASDRLLQRIALIATLVGKAPAGFGRTALMKCLYFLQTLRRVPLGYDFRLYNYGPFDADVLNDLSLAERLRAIESELSQFPGGHRYELRAGEAAERFKRGAGSFLDLYQEDINWVIRVFGNRSALDLENASTLLFVDRLVAERGSCITLSELARRVHEVKPHLDVRLIEREARSLRDRELITATP